MTMIAQYLGIDFDKVGAGPGPLLPPDGKLDHHIRLTQLKSTISSILITGAGSDRWASPLVASVWMPLLVPGGPGTVDVWFAQSQSASVFKVTVTYPDGTKETIDTTVPGPPASTDAGTMDIDMTFTDPAGRKVVIKGTAAVKGSITIT